MRVPHPHADCPKCNGRLLLGAITSICEDCGEEWSNDLIQEINVKPFADEVIEEMMNISPHELAFENKGYSVIRCCQCKKHNRVEKGSDELIGQKQKCRHCGRRSKIKRTKNTRMKGNKESDRLESLIERMEKRSGV